MSVPYPERPRRLAWVLAAALLSVGAVFTARWWFSPQPHQFPVHLTPGTIQWSEFRLRQNVRYLVELEVDRNLPFDKLHCLLGGVPFRPPCSVESVVDIQWTLKRGSQKVLAGSSRDETGWAFGNGIRRTVGQFEGSLGAKYTLEVMSNLDGSALAVTKPRIVIVVDPQVSKDQYIFALLLAYFALPVLIFVFMWLIIWAAVPDRMSASAAPARVIALPHEIQNHVSLLREPRARRFCAAFRLRR